MNRTLSFLLLFAFLLTTHVSAQIAEQETYLSSIKEELTKKWPENRTINLVYHGHSVPSGYYTGGVVRRFDSYPFMVMKQLKEKYPYAVINTITTSIGGEQSEQGAKRFASDVLSLQPDIIFIDYALNDRSIGLKRAKTAWERMVDLAGEKGVKVILLTPTPDTQVDILESDNILEQHAGQIRRLAKNYRIGLVDSFKAFQDVVASGKELNSYMAQNNHPNALGHALVAGEIMKWFEQRKQ